MPRSVNVYGKWHDLDKHSEIGFIALKEIRIGTIFGAAKRQL